MKAEQQTAPNIKTKWLVALSMLAGVGLQNVEVSKWYLAIVKTAEGIGGGLHGFFSLILQIGGSMTGFQLVMCCISFLLVVGVIWLGFTRF